MRVLNVGGASKEIPIPAHYADWEHVLLDIDARGSPDVVCDARELTKLPAAQFDAVYCSHNLEHYHRHDGPRVLGGILHVLKPDGFAEIHVPDLQALIRHVADTGIDIDDVLYTSPAGPITPRDLLYGWAPEIERSGQEFYSHKTGFTPKSLHRLLREAGFAEIVLLRARASFDLAAYAFRGAPRPEQRVLLGLPPAK
jgi:ubiquinone/menaquinone biosynthesis C-methylase UbiE